MKTNKIMVVAMMLAMAGATFTSCSKNDDEKMAEIVDDPIKDTVEYYINGKVVANNGSAISGVTVSTGDQSVKTDAEGNFVLTVTGIDTYAVVATMDGYLKATVNVTIPQGATNRASFNTSFILSKKATAVTVSADNTADVVISTASNTNVGNLDNVSSGVAVAIPGNNADLAGSEISVTEYVQETSEGNAQNSEASVSNIYIETSKNIAAEGITLAVANPVQSGDATFESFSVYKSTASRSGDGFSPIGTATLSGGNKFEMNLTEGNLAGDYSFRVNYSSSTSTGKDTESGEEDNSGSMNAIKDYKITYTEKIGWEYADQSGFNGLDGDIAQMITNAILADQGAQGVTQTTKSVSTNISGNHILYYTVENNYTLTTYKFVLTGNKNVTVKTKTYTGTKLNYQIVSADQHSGGTADGE